MIMNDSCFIQPRLTRSFKVEIHALSGEEKPSGVHRNFLQFLTQTSSTILASGNGSLLCQNLKGGRRQRFICNPITKSCFDIPTPNKLKESPSNFVRFVLKCNHNSRRVNLEEYKLILLVQYDGCNYDYEIEAYMPKYGMCRKQQKEASLHNDIWALYATTHTIKYANKKQQKKKDKEVRKFSRKGQREDENVKEKTFTKFFTAFLHSLPLSKYPNKSFHVSSPVQSQIITSSSPLATSL